MSTEVWYLGIDPARSGSAVLLSPDRMPVVSWCWCPRTKDGQEVWEVAIVQPPFSRSEIRPNLNAVSILIREGCQRVTGVNKWRISCEAVHVASFASAAISVSMNQGKLIGPLESSAESGISFYQATEWRHRLLGLKVGTKREQSKAASMAQMPIRLPGLQEHVRLSAIALSMPILKLDHITDAAGVAEYGSRATLIPSEVRCQKTTKKVIKRKPSQK